MSNTTTWISSTSGLWRTGKSWSGGVAPNSAATAVLGGATSYQVTVSQAASVGAVAITNALATLVVNAAFNVAGTLDVQGGNLVVAGGSLASGAGGTDAGGFTLTGGAVTVAAGAVLGVTGDATLGTGLYSTGGTIDGAGTLQTSGTTTILASAYDPNNTPDLTTQLFLAGGTTWVNTGLVNDNGVITFGTLDPDTGAVVAASATLDNQGTFDLNSNFTAIGGDPSLGLLVNSGLLIKQGTAASFAGAPDAVYIGVAVSSTGTVQSDSGTIEFDGGGSFAGSITGGDTVAFGGGTATLLACASIDVATLLITGGTLLAATGIEFDNTLTALAGAIGTGAGNTFTLGGEAAFAVAVAAGAAAFAITGAGTVDVTGDATVANGGSAAQLAIAGGATFDITGTFEDAGLIQVGDNGGAASTLLNDSSGVTTLTGDAAAILGAGTGALLWNDGDFAKTGGTGTSTVGVAVYNDGSIHSESGTLALTGAVTNDGGTISAEGGALAITGAIGGTGDLTLGAAATLALDGPVGSGQTVTFEDVTGLLSLGDIAGFQGTVVVNGSGDRIDVAGITGAVANVDPDSGLLTFVANGATVASLQLDTSNGVPVFVQSGDGNGGTLLTAVDGPINATLTKAVANIQGTTGNDVITATDSTLIAGDVIDGEGGTNTLKLSGGGSFDLRAPTLLADIQNVYVAEGRAAYTGKTGTIASTVQTIWLRDGLDSTVNVTSAAAKSVNPNPAAIYIHGADNNDLIKLGKGNDTVWIGGSGETITGTTGTYLFYATAATAGATINGGTGSSQLIISGGGTATLASGDKNITSVTLTDAASGTTQPDYVFTANDTRKLQITASSGNDTIVVGAATQSVIAGSGQDRVVVTAATAKALVTGGAATTIEVQGGGNATLNAATDNVTVALDQATVLTLNKMSFISVIGSSGGGDTIRTGAVGQVVTLQAAGDRLYGSASFGDATDGVTFRGTAAALNGDKIVSLGHGDVIDVTDLAYSGKVLTFRAYSSFGQIKLSDASHSIEILPVGGFVSNAFTAVDDGHGGTLIKLT